MASNGDGNNSYWKPSDRRNRTPAPRDVMLNDPHLVDPAPDQREAMRSGWVPNPDRDHFTLGVTPRADCCLRWQLHRNESVINLLCGHVHHEGCVTSLSVAYSLEGCRVCCDRSTQAQRDGELVNIYCSVHLIWYLINHPDQPITNEPSLVTQLLTYYGIANFLEIRKSVYMGVPELTQLQRERIACVLVRRQYVRDCKDQENAYTHIHSAEYRQI